MFENPQHSQFFFSEFLSIYTPNLWWIHGSAWYIFLHEKPLNKNHPFMYMDLPKGAKWFLKDVNSPSLGPFGFNWNPLEGAGR